MHSSLKKILDALEREKLINEDGDEYQAAWFKRQYNRKKFFVTLFSPGTSINCSKQWTFVNVTIICSQSRTIYECSQSLGHFRARTIYKLFSIENNLWMFTTICLELVFFPLWTFFIVHNCGTFEKVLHKLLGKDRLTIDFFEI